MCVFHTPSIYRRGASGEEREKESANGKQVFLNIVLDDAVEEKDGGEKVRLGMVVC